MPSQMGRVGGGQEWSTSSLDYGPRLEPGFKSPVSSGSGTSSYQSSPSLDEILSNTAQPPYSLSAFSAYLSSKHCLETLEFLTDAQKYIALFKENPEDPQVRVLWQRMMLSYMEHDSPRELNIPCEIRDALCQLPLVPAPDPSTLQEAVEQVKELMKENGYYPFITQVASDETCCCLNNNSLSGDRASAAPLCALNRLRQPPRTTSKHKLTSPASSGSSSPTQHSPVTPPESPSLFELSLLHSEKPSTSSSCSSSIGSPTQLDQTASRCQGACESPTQSSWRRVSKKLKWRK